MLAKKNLSFLQIIKYTGGHFIWLIGWASLCVGLYQYSGWKWLNIPWLPLSIVGTAVAFYVGFKNNNAYNRMWEARKIWGGIVNSSRAWGSYIKNFVSTDFSDNKISENELNSIKQRIIYRHIAWLYTLRSQLLIVAEWEHANLVGHIGNKARRNKKKFGIGLVDDEVSKEQLQRYIPEDEYKQLINYKNTATQIIDIQGQELAALRRKNLINDFRHVELQKILYDFYEHQGKCERIKKFPLPRQYAYMSFVFICIFIFLLPFGMLSELSKVGTYGVWLTVPFTALIGWVYVIMEVIGDHSENPFQGMSNDIPMLSLCRTIEIDLLEMLGEEDLPEPIKSKKGILM